MNNIVITPEEYEMLKKKADKWSGLVERLNGMLENYTEEERTTTAANEIKTEAVWVLELLTKYEVNW